MKSEPTTFSIEDLEKEKTTWWDGVRNYQARNFMWKEMLVGDQVLFYHSNTKPPGIVGLAQVSKSAEPDKTALDSKSSYFDPKSKKGTVRWYCVQVKFVKKFKKNIELSELRKNPKLRGMLLLQKGQRLSVQPVSKEHFAIVCQMASQTAKVKDSIAIK